jgi:hypothetical protein
VTQWKRVDPAGDVDGGVSLQEFIGVVAKIRDRAVPVVGAGLSVDAGGASSGDLLRALRDADASEEAVPTPLPGEGFFDIVDAYEARRGEEWVRSVVAAEVDRHPVQATATLKALAKVASRVIVTTNYDLSIEVSADAVGVAAAPVTLADFGAALDGEFPGLVVLHLHGLATRPETLVLGQASYDRIVNDDAAQLVLRALATGHRFVFMGQRLAPREAHIRRDILWVARATRAGAPRHLLLADETGIGSDDVDAKLDALTEETGVQVFAFPNEDGLFMASRWAATVMAGPAAVDTEDLAPTHPVPDGHYLPMAIAPADEVSDDRGRGAYLARTWQHGSVPATALDDEENLLLLLAPAGYGKSRELAEISIRSKRPSLVIPMANAVRPAQGEDAPLTFLRWARAGRAPEGTQPPTPRLTDARLREISYVFALDALDEIALAERDAVLQVIAKVSAQFPQHRWVVSSRPSPVGDDLPGFARYTLVADGAWISEYAETVGVTMRQVNEYLEHAPGVADLITIPAYGTAVVSQLREGREPPTSARGLVLSLTDDRVRAASDLWKPDQVLLWLDRVALWLRLRGRGHLTVQELEEGAFHEDLDLPAYDDLLNRLAVRALVTDLDGTIGFPADIVADARAGNALLTHGADGLAILRKHVLVELPAGPDGRAVTAIRPSWIQALELLLPDAPDEWRDAIAAVDPLLAARATPTTAPLQRRHDALHVIWQHYLQRRVWLDRGYSASHSDDRHAVERLAAADAPDDLVEQARALAREGAEPTAQANALVVLASVLTDNALLPIVRNAIGAAHPQVRAEAAVAAMRRQLRVLAPDLAAAAADADEHAAPTLLSAALMLADSGDAIRYVGEAPPSLQERGWGQLADNLPRDRLLPLVAGPPPSLVLLDVLVTTTRDGGQEWTPPQVSALAAAVLDSGIEDARYVTGVDDILKRHPLAALAPRLTREPDDEMRWDISALASALADDDLADATAALDALDAGDGAFHTLAGLDRAAELDAGAVRELRDQLAAIAQARRDPTPFPWAERQEQRRRERQDALTELVAARDWYRVLLVHDPPLAQALSEAELRDLDAFVTQRLHDLVEDGTVARMADADSLPAGDYSVLGWAQARSLSVDPEDWAPLAVFAAAWGTHDLLAWTRKAAPGDASARVEPALENLTDRQLVELPKVLPAPLSDPVVRAVFGAALRLDDEHRSRAAVDALLAQGADSLIAELAPDVRPAWLFAPLVKAGDCDAERALLNELAASPDTMARWPLRHGSQWLQYVRCPESAEAAYDAVRAALIAGRDANDLAPLFEAWQRLEGVAVLDKYDELSADPAIPHGAFLFYNRQQVIDTMAEQIAVRSLEAADQQVIRASSS